MTVSPTHLPWNNRHSWLGVQNQWSTFTNPPPKLDTSTRCSSPPTLKVSHVKWCHISWQRPARCVTYTSQLVESSSREMMSHFTTEASFDAYMCQRTQQVESFSQEMMSYFTTEASCITYTCQRTQQVESSSWEMMSHFTSEASCVTYMCQYTQQVESSSWKMMSHFTTEARCITYNMSQRTQQVESFSWKMMSYFTAKASCVTYRSQRTQQVESWHCSVVLPVYGMFMSSHGSAYTTAAIDISISINIYLYCPVSSKIYMHMEWGMVLRPFVTIHTFTRTTGQL